MAKEEKGGKLIIEPALNPHAQVQRGGWVKLEGRWAD